MKKLISRNKMWRFIGIILIEIMFLMGCFPKPTTSFSEKIEKKENSIYHIKQCYVKDPNVFEDAGNDICNTLMDRVGFELFKLGIMEKTPKTATREVIINVDYCYNPYFKGVLFSIYRSITDKPIGVKVSVDIIDITNKNTITSFKTEVLNDELKLQLWLQRSPIDTSEFFKSIAKEIAKNLANI